MGTSRHNLYPTDGIAPIEMVADAYSNQFADVPLAADELGRGFTSGLLEADRLLSGLGPIGVEPIVQIDLSIDPSVEA